jgi:hypothetical protein
MNASTPHSEEILPASALEIKMPPPLPTSMSVTGLRDNHSRGKAGDFLKEKIAPGSALSFVSAYFTATISLS